MYNYIYYKNKRLALGLSVSQVAEEAGVSNQTVYNFEDSQKNFQVSEPYKKAICAVLNGHMHNLGKMKFLEVKLLENVLNASEPTVRDEEKLSLLTSAINNASKIQVDIYQMKRQERAEMNVH